MGFMIPRHQPVQLIWLQIFFNDDILFVKHISGHKIGKCSLVQTDKSPACHCRTPPLRKKKPSFTYWNGNPCGWFRKCFNCLAKSNEWVTDHFRAHPLHSLGKSCENIWMMSAAHLTRLTFHSPFVIHAAHIRGSLFPISSDSRTIKHSTKEKKTSAEKNKHRLNELFRIDF